MEETLARIFQFTLAISAAFAIALWFALAVWAYRDISRRTESASVQIASTLLVALGFVPGAIVYLLLRPRETLDDRRQRIVEETYLEQELANLIACPECDTLVRDDFVYCPTCGTQLREFCPSCGKSVDISWRVCAYCGESIREHTIIAEHLTNGRETSRQSHAGVEWEVDVVEEDDRDQPSADSEPEPVDAGTRARMATDDA